jgi:hypothetical protein
LNLPAPMIVLETERLVLSRLTLDDAPSCAGCSTSRRGWSSSETAG